MDQTPTEEALQMAKVEGIDQCRSILLTRIAGLRSSQRRNFDGYHDKLIKELYRLEGRMHKSKKG